MPRGHAFLSLVFVLLQSCSTAYWQSKNFNSKTNGPGPGVACDALTSGVDTRWMVARAVSHTALGSYSRHEKSFCSETSLPAVRRGVTYAGRRKWKVSRQSQDQAITWADNKLSLNCKNASDLHLQGHELHMAGLASKGLAPRRQAGAEL